MNVLPHTIQQCSALWHMGCRCLIGGLLLSVPSVVSVAVRPCITPISALPKYMHVGKKHRLVNQIDMEKQWAIAKRHIDSIYMYLLFFSGIGQLIRVHVMFQMQSAHREARRTYPWWGLLSSHSSKRPSSSPVDSSAYMSGRELYHIKYRVQTQFMEDRCDLDI